MGPGNNSALTSGYHHGFPSNSSIHLSASPQPANSCMHCDIPNPLLEPLLASKMAREGDSTLTPSQLCTLARAHSSLGNSNRGPIPNPLKPHPTPRVHLSPPAIRPPLTRQNAWPTQEFPVTNYFAPSSPDSAPLPTTGFTAPDAPTRRNASPTEESPATNYFASSSPDTAPITTTGFTAPDAPTPKQPKQPRLQPRNILGRLSKDDGLYTISAAEPGDFFFNKGSEFDLPPPQTPVETPNRSQVPEAAVNGHPATEVVGRDASSGYERDSDLILSLYTGAKRQPVRHRKRDCFTISKLSGSQARSSGPKTANSETSESPASMSNSNAKEANKSLIHEPELLGFCRGRPPVYFIPLDETTAKKDKKPKSENSISRPRAMKTKPIPVFATKEFETPSDVAARLATTHYNQMMDLYWQIKKKSERQSFGPERLAKVLERLAVGHYQNMKKISKELTLLGEDARTAAELLREQAAGLYIDSQILETDAAAEKTKAKIAAKTIAGNSTCQAPEKEELSRKDRIIQSSGKSFQDLWNFAISQQQSPKAEEHPLAFVSTSEREGHIETQTYLTITSEAQADTWNKPSVRSHRETETQDNSLRIILGDHSRTGLKDVQIEKQFQVKQKSRETRSKAEAFRDVRKLGANYRLATPMPADIAAILAKDPAKQKKMQKNAKPKTFEATKQVESYKNSNSDLLQRLRKVDRKTAEQKVETLLSRRVESGLQKSMEDIAANDDIQPFFNFLSYNFDMTGDYYDFDRALGSLKEALDFTANDDTFRMRGLQMSSHFWEDETYDNTDEVALPSPTWPELARAYKAKTPATMEGCCTCKTCQEIKDLSKEQSKADVRGLGYQANAEYKEGSAVEKEFVVSMCANREAPASEEPSEIQRETPLHLTPRQPILVLRPALHAEETESIENASAVNEANKSNDKSKRKANRGCRGGKKHHKTTTHQVIRPSRKEASTSEYESESKEQGPATRTEYQENVTKSLETRETVRTIRVAREAVLEKQKQDALELKATQQSRRDFEVIVRKTRERRDLAARLAEDNEQEQKLRFDELHSVLKKQRPGGMAIAEALGISSSEGIEGEEEWSDVERDDDGDGAAANEIQEGEYAVELVHVENVEAETEDEDGAWSDVEAETEEEFYDALVVQDDLKLL